MKKRRGETTRPKNPGSRLKLMLLPRASGRSLVAAIAMIGINGFRRLCVNALPVNQKNADTVSKAGSAVAAGMVDMKPADPIEGMRYLNWSWRMRPHCHCTSEPGLAIQLITLKRIHNISRLLTRPQEQ